MKNLCKITSVFAVFLIIFTCMGSIVNADNSDSLTIICRKEDVILSDMEWKIFYVADINDSGKYNAVNKFADYPVSLEDQSVSALQEAAGKYETYTIIDNITPLNHGVTDENGKVVFSTLETGLYLVTGEPVRVDDMAYVPVPSLIELNEENKNGTSWTYDLTSLPKLKVLPATTLIRSQYTVKKEWLNDNEGIRPEYVTAVLYRNGVEFSTAVLNEQNNWQFVWNDLSMTADWKIEEQNVPGGYTVSYTESNDIVTITNTYTPILTGTSSSGSHSLSSASGLITGSSDKLPQTGMLLWPVPVLGISGIVIFIAGWFIYKRGKNEK